MICIKVLADLLDLLTSTSRFKFSSVQQPWFYLPLAAGHQAHNWGVVDVEDALEVGPLGHHPS